MVQLCCLGAGVLADYQPVDLEPAAGVGPSPAPGSRTHHRVCSCSPHWAGFGYRLGFACAGLWTRRGRHDLEGGSLLGSRLCLSARWHVVLSRRAEADRSRAQRAHSRLSFQERLARNTRDSTAARITVRLFGVPERVTLLLGLTVA